ncbi:hypothetical protein [Kribbella sp.]|uniref:hypothetical protein n=1 Tax=Kribbella sp. TaxID=1871183 RepID=UPI002D24D9B9|nr:hypothetical protein [Kribbella sp.]HZX04974.1 hypothetical protein [Kribbella sp.]
MTSSRKLTVWLVLTVGAFVVLLAWAFPDAIEHRGRIHAVSTQVVVCAAEQPHNSRTQVLHHLADCAGDNRAVRHQLRDELTALLLAGITIAGAWRLLRRT